MSDKTLISPFTKHPPNFSELLEKYPYLESSKESDKLQVDSLRFFRMLKFDHALSRAVLKEYFDLELSLPTDYLTPNIASLVGHMLWIEEILHATFGAEKFIRVLDVGTDASFVYPLIGAKYFKWNVVCTKTNQTDFDYAVKNVEDNDLSSSIQILKVNEGCLITGALAELEDGDFDFVISNVPEFEWKKCQKSVPIRANMRPMEDLRTDVMASDLVEQLVLDSFQTRNQVKICFLTATKKAHCSLVRQELKKIHGWGSNSNTDYSNYQHFACIAWTFDASVVFPMVQQRREIARNLRRETKRHPSWDVPEDIRCLDVYDRTRLCEKLTRLFEGLLIPCEEEEIDDDSGNKSLIITAYMNTWDQRKNPKDDEESGATKPPDQETSPVIDDGSGQPSGEAQKKRNKRWRRKGGKQKQNGKDNTRFDGDDSSKEAAKHQQAHPAETVPNCAVSGDSLQAVSDCQNVAASSTRKRRASDSEPLADPSDQPEDCGPSAKLAMLECPPVPEQHCPNPVPREESPMDCDDNDDAGTPRHLVKARLLVRIHKDKLRVEMQWISGTKRDAMQHIFQFVRDYLKYT